MGFKVINGAGEVTSNTVFWGGIPIDVLTIAKVEDRDPEDTSVLVMTEHTRHDETLEMRANAIEMGSTEAARAVYDLAVEHLAKNEARKKAS